MKLAKVIGRVFCARQCCNMDSKRLLLIQPLVWDNGEPSGDPIVAADCAGAGAGEKVFFVQSREAIAAFADCEPENSAGETLSEKRLIPLFGGDQDLSMVLDQIHAEIATFSSGTQQIDDITLLAVKRKGKLT